MAQWHLILVSKGEKLIDTAFEKIDDGKYSVEAVLIRTDDGYLLYVGGGEKSHIGTIVICQPRPSKTDSGCISCTTSVINRLSHKDDSVIVPAAEAICKKTNSTVAAAGGLHLDDAASEDIKRLTDNMFLLADKLLEKVNAYGTAGTNKD
jgi:hypothetical protein